MSTGTVPSRALVTSMCLLFGVSFFNYMDRYMLSVLLPAIKTDLVLSDFQLGIISGFAFTLFYATLGVPIARLADKHSRRRIVSAALAVWSLMTAACGLAQSFIQLTIARVLVGVGEAGATPPSHSLISDYYAAGKRTLGMSIYSLGAPVGILVGFIVGSWLAENYSWRHALIAVGVPGILLSGLVLTFLHEPPRGGAAAGPADDDAPSLRQVAARLLKSRAFVMFAVGTGLYTVVWLGVIGWLPSYFTRSFDMSLSQAGFWLALVLGFSQIIGMLLSGFVTDSLVGRDTRWYALVPTIAVGVATPLFLLVFFTSSAWVGFALLFPAFMISVMQGPATFSAIQGLVPPRMRAMASAVLLLVTNLIGGGLGTTLVGLFSDLLTPRFGDEALRFSLLGVAVGFSVLATLSYFVASMTIRQELAAQNATAASP
ncbi:MAG: MFS transporter [Pseudomonadota bacterium]